MLHPDSKIHGNAMNIHTTPLEGLYCLEASPFSDKRGAFARIFCQDELKQMGLSMSIAQMNISLTYKKGALRGMHYQVPPYAEIKIVRCLQGSCYDVAIDLRKDSPTFLQYHAEILSAENGKALYIPKGFAHGFQTLEDNTQLLYAHSELYAPHAEAALHYNDPRINIDWQLPITECSDRDENHPFIQNNFMGITL